MIAKPDQRNRLMQKLRAETCVRRKNRIEMSGAQLARNPSLGLAPESVLRLLPSSALSPAPAVFSVSRRPANRYAEN